MMTVPMFSPSVLAFLFYSDIRTDCGNLFEFSATLLRELHILQALCSNSILMGSVDGLLHSGLLRDRFLDSLHLSNSKRIKYFGNLICSHFQIKGPGGG